MDPAADLEPAEAASIIVVTGALAAGSGRVCELLTLRFPQGVLLRGEGFRTMILSGRVDMSPTPQPDALRQLALRHRITASAATEFAAAGFTVVVHDLFAGNSLGSFLHQVTWRPLHLVTLAPDVDGVLADDALRARLGQGDGWALPGPDRVVRHAPRRAGLWLDTSRHTDEESVDAILERLDEARLP